MGSRSHCWVAAVVALCLTAGCSRRSGQQGATPVPEPKSGPNPAKPAPTEARQTRIYLVDVEKDRLVPEQIDLPEGPLDKQIETVVKALAEAEETASRVRCIPPGATLTKVSMTGDTAVLDFSEAFSEPSFWAGSETELLRVYALVDSVTELKGVRRVRLLTEGQPIESLGGHVELTEPVTRDETLIAEQ
ncbi:MAG: hypothetical protein COZ06_19805 [Armatimonadetes bacterium CG_4_10_14_3_um_filter_66_18]|nr:GerMN domain-containing protein [Armatimonadota bacterium]OIO97549.1 MAG: hypothetical protein AUJ96_22965 [Armatimonadetes bacterium CG2_30_66_41]PIU89802.1 MAG: hypothetical protein COS65_27270 [Armatimonadetes bacterium CG06_land_8_20_14_3_00_66_21]PIX39945.1 MAG: hypothetical protein COZ57_27130 [Armatimonadetes bacterium CG_4_8_14_3_um_filter_66_20]PIY44738.1 MAG: hypothetical protein COZ06_19805 [Armatimonadetes bacterium CG_4_10_14_3_um_filter_66_18]PIZ48857.1 MAG: hypothetical prote